MCYGLYNGEFRQYSNNDFLRYNKAYLRLPASSASAKTLSISTDETPTGISEVNDSKKQNAPYYTPEQQAHPSGLLHTQWQESGVGPITFSPHHS